VSETGDETCDWLQTTAGHDVVWSIFWAGDHGELSCAHWNGEWQFHAKSHELIGAFLACPPDWAQGPPLLRDVERGLPLPVCRNYCTRLVDSLKQTVDASSSPTVGKFTQRPSCTISFWQIEILNQNLIFLWNFHDSVYFFYIYLGLDSFPR